jgi:ABC-type transport system substrate-binding protein
MDHPVVGGYTPEKVALRRAISLAYDVDVEITQIRRGGLRAQSPVVPHTTGFDAAYKSEMGDYDPARAKALLDTYGYVDRDGDGWRELPDGKPLLIEMATQSDQLTRKYDELWKKCLTAVGIQIEFKTAQWPENLKALRAGKLMIWQLGSSAASPDGQSALMRLYGPQGGKQNLSRFKLEAFDRIYQRMEVIADGPEREKLFLEAKRIAAAYMPYRYTAHRAEADMLHPWVIGFYKRPTFWNDWWHMVDVDLAKKPRGLA